MTLFMAPIEALNHDATLHNRLSPPTPMRPPENWGNFAQVDEEMSDDLIQSDEEDDEDDGECDEIFASATRRTRSSKPQVSSTERASGRWTRAEHEEFLKCLDIYGREWKKVSQRITTRTAAQIRSHAQKYFKKMSSTADQKVTPQPAVTTTKKQPQQVHVVLPMRDEAVAVVEDVITTLRAKRDRCAALVPTAKRPRFSNPEEIPPWRRRASEPNLARLDLDPMERPKNAVRRRVVSCEDLGDSELIALEMLCTNHSPTHK